MSITTNYNTTQSGIPVDIGRLFIPINAGSVNADAFTVGNPLGYSYPNPIYLNPGGTPIHAWSASLFDSLPTGLILVSVSCYLSTNGDTNQSQFFLGISQNFSSPSNTGVLYGPGIIGLERSANASDTYNLQSFTLTGIMNVTSSMGLFLVLSPVVFGSGESLNFNIESGYWVYLGPAP